MADLIGSLPAHAADRLRTLRQRVADLHAVVPMFEERQQANAAQFEAAQRLKRLQAHVSEGGFHLPDDDPRVRDEQRNVKRLAAEAKRLNDRYEMRSQAWTTAGQTLAHCESWLRDGKPAGVVLRDHADEVPKLAKDEDVLTFVERHRRRVRELKADLHRIESAPFPSSHAKQKMRQTVEALAQRGAPSVSHLIEHDRDVEFATEDVSVPIMGNKESPLATVAVWQQANTLALFCWLHRDTLIARLDAEIASEADDASALSHDERQRRAAETQADLLATERIECAAVWMAMAQNLLCEFRPDTDPVALLNLALVVATPAVASGLSWQHALDLSVPVDETASVRLMLPDGRVGQRIGLTLVRCLSFDDQRHSSSRSRRTASLAGFFDLSHVFDGPTAIGRMALLVCQIQMFQTPL